MDSLPLYIYMYEWKMIRLKKENERLFRNEKGFEKGRKSWHMVERMMREPQGKILSVSSFVSNIVNLFRTMFAHKVENDSVKHLLHFFQTYPPLCIPIFTGWISKGIKYRDTTVTKFPSHHRLFVRYFRFDDEYQEIVEMRRDTNANETKGQTYTHYRMPCYETRRASASHFNLPFNQIKIDWLEKAIKTWQKIFSKT